MVIAKQKILQISVYAFVFILLSSIYQNDALADSKTYSADPLKRLEVIISDKGVNRITIEKDRILKIIGNEGDYTIDGDSNKGFVFLNSKVEKGENFPVTIISEKGLVQDIKFSVKGDIDSSTVIIKTVEKSGNNRKLIPKRASAMPLEQKVTTMISEIFKGQTSRYQVKEIKVHHSQESLDLSRFPIKVKKITEYISKNHDLKVTKYEFLVKYHTEGPLASSTIAAQIEESTGSKVVAISERGNNLLVVSKL